MAAVTAGRARAEPLEGLEQALDLGGRDERPGVSYRQEGLAVADSGADADLPPGDVVPGGVVDEVGGQLLDEKRVAVNSGGFEGGLDPQAQVADRGADGGQRGAGDGGQVEWLVLAVGGFAACQGEQRVDEALLLALDASSSLPTACQVPGVASGSARVTWSRVRSLVRGVRSSCEALAANRRCASKEASSRANRLSKVSASSLSSSSGPRRDSRSCRLLAEIRRAAAVIVLSGRSTRPASSQPSTAAPTTKTTTAMTEMTVSCCRSMVTCPRPATVTWTPGGSPEDGDEDSAGGAWDGCPFGAPGPSRGAEGEPSARRAGWSWPARRRRMPRTPGTPRRTGRSAAAGRYDEAAAASPRPGARAVDAHHGAAMR